MITRKEIADRLKAMVDEINEPRDPVRPLSDIMLVERIGDLTMTLDSLSRRLERLSEEVLK